MRRFSIEQDLCKMPSNNQDTYGGTTALHIG